MSGAKEYDIQSIKIIAEVQKRSVLYDTTHISFGDRSAKSRCWQDVCAAVLPHWRTMSEENKQSCEKEIQKRWRSIRDSYTKQYRAGKCAPPGTLPHGGGRRLQQQRQLGFLYDVLQRKNYRVSTDRDMMPLSNLPRLARTTITLVDDPTSNLRNDRVSIDTDKDDVADRVHTEVIEIDNSKPTCCIVKVESTKEPTPSIQIEPPKVSTPALIVEPTIDLTSPTKAHTDETKDADLTPQIDKKNDQVTQTEADMFKESDREDKDNGLPDFAVRDDSRGAFRNIELPASLDIRIDTNSVLAQDHFNDDSLFMNSLLPFFRNMDDTMKLTCRIEILKIIRYFCNKQTKEVRVVKIKEEDKSCEESECSLDQSKETEVLDQPSAQPTSSSKNEEEESAPVKHRRGRGRPRKSLQSPQSLRPGAAETPTDWSVLLPVMASQKREERARKRLHRDVGDDTDSAGNSERQSRNAARLERARRREQTRGWEQDDDVSRATDLSQLRPEDFLKIYNLKAVISTSETPKIEREESPEC